MKRMVCVICCLVLMANVNVAFAGKIDREMLKKITGTKWELQCEKKPGLFHRTRTDHPPEETITFSDGSILFDLPDAHYSCNYTLKNKHEFWLYCAEPDQYVYVMRKLSTSELVFDVLVKNKDGKYLRKKRVVYHRAAA